MSKIKNFILRLLSLFIPNKVFRGYVRAGVAMRFFRAKYLMRKKYKFIDQITIIAMVRNESDYLNEWINYHKLLGVTKFYIFDNESTDKTRQILQPHINSGLVVYEYLPDKKIEKLKPVFGEQVKSHVAHWIGIGRAAATAKWIAIIDVDEFIVPKRDKNLSEFLSHFNADVSQIILGWTVFGSNGHIEKPDGLVIENYTMRGQGHNGMDLLNNFKSIVNPRAMVMDCNHYHRVIGKTVDASGRPENIWENTDKIMPTDICTINHYIVRSYAEYKRKMENNKNIHAFRYDDSYFTKFDVNDVGDESILKFLPELKKIM